MLRREKTVPKTSLASSEDAETADGCCVGAAAAVEVEAAAAADADEAEVGRAGCGGGSHDLA